VLPDAPELLSLFGIGVVLTLLVGFYSVLTSQNLIRTLIGMEVLTKGVTLLIIVVGYVVGQIALAQALAITLIIIEVAVIVVAVGIVLCVHKHTNSIDTRDLGNLKG
jgi:NADH-quinone oxidoreductase subunit K